MLHPVVRNAVLIGTASVMLAGCWPFVGGGQQVEVTTPVANARVTSPLRVEGVALSLIHI